MDKLALLQEKPDKAIPAETFKKARGIIIMERTRAGVVFAFMSGKGVAWPCWCATNPAWKWGPGAVLWRGSGKRDFGAQIGGESYVVGVIFDDDEFDPRMVRDSNLEFGGEVHAAPQAGEFPAAAPEGTSNST